jgi:hypothetical protein
MQLSDYWVKQEKDLKKLNTEGINDRAVQSLLTLKEDEIIQNMGNSGPIVITASRKYTNIFFHTDFKIPCSHIVYSL